MSNLEHSLGVQGRLAGKTRLQQVSGADTLLWIPFPNELMAVLVSAMLLSSQHETPKQPNRSCYLCLGTAALLERLEQA